jgi:hypothetical protein
MAKVNFNVTVPFADWILRTRESPAAAEHEHASVY